MCFWPPNCASFASGTVPLPFLLPRFRQVSVETQILVRRALGEQDDLIRVAREVLDDVENRLEHERIVALNGDGVRQSRGRQRSNDAPGVVQERAENSLGLWRVLGAPPIPDKIHCRTLPSRCSSRLPTAFSFSDSRAHRNSCDNFGTHVSMRSRFSASLPAAAVRKICSNVIQPSADSARQYPSKKGQRALRGARGLDDLDRRREPLRVGVGGALNL